MIVTEFVKYQGLGNQLWYYTVLRTLAFNLGFEFGIGNVDLFCGQHFMNLDFGKKPINILQHYKEKFVSHPSYTHCNISKIDKLLLNICDHTKISGIMQSEDYIYQQKDKICNWLKIKAYPSNFDVDNTCIVNFRGGDFMKLPRFLNKDYYTNAINYMKSLYSRLNFCIVTDDPIKARQYFKDYKIIGRASNGICFVRNNSKVGDIGIDYAIINSAKYLIIPNSSFSWWAAWTNKIAKIIIAPMYWTAYNFSDGFWSSEDILTREWLYLDRYNKVRNYDECLHLKTEYEDKNKNLWQ